MDEYNSLKFASLFHDIGKFYQRADNNFHPSFASKYKNLDKSDYGEHGAHSKWSADFVSLFYDESVENLVLYHHNPTKHNSINHALAKILQVSNHHSSKEGIRTDEYNNVESSPLISIFSKISLNNDKSDEFFIPLAKLDFNNDMYPKSEEVSKNWNIQRLYEKLWDDFKNEFKLIPNNDFETALAVVKKFTSTIPSSTHTSVNDISLYDHLKTTTAIANCRYLFSQETPLENDDEQKVYRIVNGDISGIQNFIYRVNSPKDAQNGMSKRLRGRSIYLSLLTEAIANKIIIDLNLDSTNILFCGGGRFTIIAPNINITDDVLKRIDEDVNNFFISQFNAELYLALVSSEASGNNLDKFSKVISELNGLLTENKKHKFKGHLSEVFSIEDKVDYELCPVCGNKTDETGKLCSECDNHEQLGGIVANSNYMLRYENKNEIERSAFFIDFLGIGYIFAKDFKELSKLVNKYDNVKFSVFRLNNTNFLESCNEIRNINVSFDFKSLGNSVPAINNQPLYFNHLAEISKGANKLSVLKMDVDNLGKIFSQGFSHLNDGDGGASISRLSSLSFYLDLFFSGFINNISEKFKVFLEDFGHEEYFDKTNIRFDNGKIKSVYKLKIDAPDEFKNEIFEFGISTIYINYSGGDDLLVVGPYDDIIKFAYEFRSAFKEWTADNDFINISGGISMISPKFPIGKAALLADDELEKSKVCGKNKISVFGEILAWDSKGNIKGFADLLDFGEKLEALCPNVLSKGFIYSLLKIWNATPIKEIPYVDEESWEKNNGTRLSTKRYVPLFMYKLRIIKDKELKNELSKEGIKFMPWIKIPVSWVSLRLR